MFAVGCGYCVYLVVVFVWVDGHVFDLLDCGYCLVFWRFCLLVILRVFCVLYFMVCVCAFGDLCFGVLILGCGFCFVGFVYCIVFELLLRILFAVVILGFGWLVG